MDETKSRGRTNDWRNNYSFIVAISRMSSIERLRYIQRSTFSFLQDIDINVTATDL